MKLAVASDIHLEFGPITLENTEKADVLVLSGDICVAKDVLAHDDPMESNKSKMIHEFFQKCCEEFPHVVYVAGNHEHYHGDFKYTMSHLKKMFNYLTNLHVLDCDVFDFNEEFRFIGGTLWTDMNNEDPLTLHSMTGRMNDFRCVENSDRKVTRKVPIYKKDENGVIMTEDIDGYSRSIIEKYEFREYDAKFSPEDAVADHKKMLKYIEHVYNQTPDTMKIVVVGHHAPSKASTHPRYIHETIMNGGYSSNLSDFILDRPKIKLWTHGHTHEDFDYMVGNTRIVCNPRGYIDYEARADNFKLKVIEL